MTRIFARAFPCRDLLRSGIILLTVLTCHCGIFETSAQKPPLAQKGVLDLRQWDFAKLGPVSLTGDWEFFWRRHLVPADFARDDRIQRTGFLAVPGVWNQFKLKGKSLGGDGFATYRLKVLLGKSDDLLALKLLEMKTAYRVFVNGKEIASNGTPGNSRLNSRPQYLPGVRVFSRRGDELEIVLQVSNFHHRYGGPWRKTVLGNEAQVRGLRATSSSFELFLMGSMFIMGLYHLSLYWMRRKDRSSFYFGLLSIIVATRIFTEGEHFWMQNFPEFNWEALSTVQYLGTYGLILVLVLFLRSIFPRAFPRWVVYVTAGICALFTLPVIFQNAWVYTRTGPAIYLFILALCVYITGALIYSKVHRRQGALTFLVGWTFLLVTIINDILHDLLVIQTAYLFPVGIFVFMFSQAVVLAIRFSGAFRTAEHLSRRLLSLDRLKDDLLANTSHELRTPINGIIGLTESLLEGSQGELTDGARKSLSMVAAGGRRLGALINDILDSTKLKHRNIQLQRRALDLSAVTDEVLYLSEPLAYGKPLTLLNEIPEDLPAVYADDGRLKQILHNLIANAIKFTESGTVRVIAAKADDSTIQISVVDTGIGIPSHKLQDIFRSFEQADSSISRQYGGAGLGLSITKQLVEMHGGGIHAKSHETGTGATFIFQLPISRNQVVPDEKAGRIPGLRENSFDAAPTNLPLPEEGSNGHHPRILAVDDDPTNLELLTHYLKKEEFNISRAVGGREALELLKNGNPPDLILLDVMMPNLSGYETLKALRESHSIQELPVILLTAKDQVSDLVLGFQAGGNDFLTKPIQKEVLLCRVHYHLRMAASHRELRK